MESQSDQQTPHSIIYFILRNPRYCSQDKQLKTGHGECESRLPKLLHTESEEKRMYYHSGRLLKLYKEGYQFICKNVSQ